jgi:hypothetical protein
MMMQIKQTRDQFKTRGHIGREFAATHDLKSEAD